MHLVLARGDHPVPDHQHVARVQGFVPDRQRVDPIENLVIQNFGEAHHEAVVDDGDRSGQVQDTHRHLDLGTTLYPRSPAQLLTKSMPTGSCAGSGRPAVVAHYHHVAALEGSGRRNEVHRVDPRSQRLGDQLLLASAAGGGVRMRSARFFRTIAVSWVKHESGNRSFFGSSTSSSDQVLEDVAEFSCCRRAFFGSIFSASWWSETARKKESGAGGLWRNGACFSFELKCTANAGLSAAVTGPSAAVELLGSYGAPAGDHPGGHEQPGGDLLFVAVASPSSTVKVVLASQRPLAPTETSATLISPSPALVGDLDLDLGLCASYRDRVAGRFAVDPDLRPGVGAARAGIGGPVDPDVAVLPDPPEVG